MFRAVMLVTSLSAFPAGLFADEPKTGDRLKVLIVDGQNNHAWQVTTPHMKKWLEACGRFTVEVATSPARPHGPAKPKPDAGPEAQEKYEKEVDKFRKAEQDYRMAMSAFRPDFGKFDAVVLNYNGDAWPAETNLALEEAVGSGQVGLVIVHAANNSFPGQWKEYDLMIGMGWRDARYGDRLIIDDEGNEKRLPAGQGPGAGHGPMHAFRITLRDREHPVTKGMPAEWMHARDELYQGMRGPIQNVRLLATAYADQSQGGTGEHEPIIWTVDYRKGRVFHTPMGHDVAAMHCIGFIATLQRGTEWAATGAVTVPLPKEFPGAENPSVVPGK